MLAVAAVLAAVQSSGVGGKDHGQNVPNDEGDDESKDEDEDELNVDVQSPRGSHRLRRAHLQVMGRSTNCPGSSMRPEDPG